MNPLAYLTCNVVFIDHFRYIFCGYEIEMHRSQVLKLRRIGKRER